MVCGKNCQTANEAIKTGGGSNVQSVASSSTIFEWKERIETVSNGLGSVQNGVSAITSVLGFFAPKSKLTKTMKKIDKQIDGAERISALAAQQMELLDAYTFAKEGDQPLSPRLQSRFLKHMTGVLLVLTNPSESNITKYKSETQSLLDEIGTPYGASRDNRPDNETITFGRIVDGDTFVDANGQKIRLIGVNTPELHGDNGLPEFYGQEAKEFTERTLAGKKLLIVKDKAPLDRYGRSLRYVYIMDDNNPQNSQFFNAMLVQQGFARTMNISPNSKYKDTFANLEEQARRERKGVWKR